MFYKELFKAFEERRIRYLVVGGVAVVLHGFVRATMDLDLMVALDQENLLKFLNLMKERGYAPKPPVPMDDFSIPEKRQAWKNEKGMLVFSIYHRERSHELIDILVDEPVPFEDAYKRRVLVSLDEINISVISVPDLVTLKERAGREQDREDIRALRELK